MKAALVTTMSVSVILFWFTCSPAQVSAAESTAGKNWEFAAQLYFWGASVGATTRSGRDIDIGIGDIIDNLDFALMGSVEAKKNRWLLAADMIYLDAGKDFDSAHVIKATADITSWIVTPMIGYNLVDTGKVSLDIIGGARYLSLDTDIGVDALGERVNASESIWDGIIGARGSVDFTASWYLFGLLDVGAGDSDLTWQALGGIGYRFEQFSIMAAYRYMRWNLSDDIKALDDLALHGPALGLKYVF